jgi:hypothetical protein
VIEDLGEMIIQKKETFLKNKQDTIDRARDFQKGSSKSL